MSDHVTRLAAQLRTQADLIERGEIPIGPADALVALPVSPATGDRLIELARSGNAAAGLVALAEAALDFVDGQPPRRAVSAAEMCP